MGGYRGGEEGKRETARAESRMSKKEKGHAGQALWPCVPEENDREGAQSNSGYGGGSNINPGER